MAPASPVREPFGIPVPPLPGPPRPAPGEPAEVGTRRTAIHWVYFATLYFLVSGALFYLYLARVLPPDALGAVVLYQAIATVVSAAVVLGLGSGFQHFLSFYRGHHEPETVRRLVRASFVASALLGTVAFLATFGLSSGLAALLFRSDAFQNAIDLAGLYAALLVALTILLGVILGLQRFRLFAIRAIATYTLTYGGAALFVTWWRTPTSVVYGWILGSAVGSLLYLVAVLWERWDEAAGRPAPASSGAGPASHHTALPLYRSVLVYSLPVFASTLLTTSATYVDRLILASVSTLSSVGFYNYALLVVGGSLVVATPFVTILVPRLSEHLGRSDRNAIQSTVRLSVTLVVLVYVPFALLLAGVGPFLLRWLVGPAYVRDSLAMGVLLVLAAAAVPYIVLTSLAQGIRRTPALAKAAGFSLTANALLTFLLVPHVGILGAAIGNSAMYWGLLIVLTIELRTSGYLSVDLVGLLRIWAASATTLLTVALPLYLGGYGVLHVVGFGALGVSVILASLKLLKAVPQEAAEFIAHLLPRSLRFLDRGIRWVAR